MKYVTSWFITLLFLAPNLLYAEISGSFATVDHRYAKGEKYKGDIKTTWNAVAWKGERIHKQLVIWGNGPVADLQVKTDKEVKTYLELPVWTTGNKELYDALSDKLPMEIEKGESCIFWVSVDIPHNAKPGLIKKNIIIKGAKSPPIEFEISIKVVNKILPPPQEWSYHLDLWQTPTIIADYHKIPHWSDEHFQLLRPLYKILADSGQKVITVYIKENALGRPSMVKWIRKEDGSWKYDFSVMDKYVTFMMSLGISRQISCFSPLGWNENVTPYYNKASGKMETLKAPVGTAEYKNAWKPFLKAFEKHMRRKNWFDRTVLIMDESKMPKMLAFLKFAKECAPEFKLGMATNHRYMELEKHLHDMSISFRNVPSSLMENRLKQNKITTPYVCCSPKSPNTFTISQPAESTWLSWFVASRKYSGLLRWTYDRWDNANPFDTRVGKSTSGDFSLVYPDAMSSIRMERLREGIQDYEKIRILRNSTLTAKKTELMKELDEHLKRFGKERSSWSSAVNEGKALVNRISLELCPKSGHGVEQNKD